MVVNYYLSDLFVDFCQFCFFFCRNPEDFDKYCRKPLSIDGFFVLLQPMTSYLKTGLILALIFCFSPSFSQNSTQKPLADTTKYRLVVSFFSVSAGIDLEAKREFDIFLAEFEKTNQVSIARNETRWGREGEVDYCLSLEGINKKGKKKIISKIKSISKKSKLISVLENHHCLHKR